MKVSLLMKMTKLQIRIVLAYYIPFRVSRVSGAHPRGFAPGPTYQGCSGGESLATCERLDRLGAWTPYLSHQTFFNLAIWLVYITWL